MALPKIAENLATAFLGSDWSARDLARRGRLACGQGGRWLRGLVRRLLKAFPGQPAANQLETLTRFIESDRAFLNASRGLTVRQYFWLKPVMDPAAGTPASWQVPAIVTAGVLADWLGICPGELDWFADRQGREAKVPPGPLRHYTYQWLRTSRKARLLEAPKARLKAIQRRILHDILDCIPPHDAAHGFRAGRSLASFVAPHAGQRIVLRLDLRDFFASIRARRIERLFRIAGYPSAVARILAGLCTNVVPDDAWPAPSEEIRLPHRPLFARPHLPQGAPTSPALANLCAYRLDCRLAALARAAGARYTRYADDLAFSGARDFERSSRRFHVQVCLVALEEGFEVNTRKTRFMRPGVRQYLAGLVVNCRPNIIRADYDLLKATLHNCIVQGPRSQNHDGYPDFRAHLLGRIAWVEQFHSDRGRRLREMFDHIRWEMEV
jgi:hypothetical protein